MQDLQTSFKVLLGSQEKAVLMTKNLIAMGAATPFETQQLAEYTKKMLSMGYAENEVIGIMSRMGDVSLGNAGAMMTIVDAMGKAKAMGKLQGGELNRLQDQGFTPLQIIMAKTGETMDQVRDRMEAGKIPYKELEDALVTATSKGGRFYQGMAEGSKTFNGQLSTLKDTWNSFIGELTAPIFEKLMQILPVVIDFLGKLGEKFKALDDNTKTIILVIGGLVAGVGPLLIVFGTLITIVGGVITGISAIAGVIAALTPEIIVIGVALGAQIAIVTAIIGTIGAVIGYVLQQTGALQLGFDSLVQIFNTAKPVIIDLIQNGWEKMRVALAVVKSVLDDVSRTMAPFIQETTTRATPIIKDIVKALGEFANALIDAFGIKIVQVKQIWDAVWPLLKPTVSIVFDTVKTIVITALEVIKGVIRTATAIIKGDWSGAWNGIKSIFSSIWNGITDTASKQIAIMTRMGKSIIQGLISGIKSMVGSVGNAIGETISSGISKAKGLLPIPGFASGVRNFSGGLAMVGKCLPTLNRVKSVKSKLNLWIKTKKYGKINTWDRLSLINLIEKELQTLLPI
jgi:tape measure domain-containing protein